MMATAAVIGLSAGKRLLGSSFYYSDLNEKLTCSSDHSLPSLQAPSVKNVITAKKSSDYSPSCVSSRKLQSAKALKEHADIASDPSDVQSWFERFKQLQNESNDEDNSVEVLLLLQKSMLEKQWNLSAEETLTAAPQHEKNCKKMHITCSGTSARRRRMDSRQRVFGRKSAATPITAIKPLRSIIGPELLQNRLRGYVKGSVSEELLTHTEVLQLSKKIQVGLRVEEQKSRLKERLGCEPSDDQLALSLKMSHSDLQSTLIECSLARERLSMSNVRLVMSIAQRYDNMGAEMADLIQGGLIGLLRGIEKFDPSKGYKISTYVYWWIRQGVSRTLVENSRTLRLPTHLHERLCLIRNAKIRLEEKGITPSVNNIAASLNMSQKKVRNATEASSKVYSLDREAFPSLNGLPGETLHSYIADNHLENNPWHGVDVWALKDEVNNLISSTLRILKGYLMATLFYEPSTRTRLSFESAMKRLGGEVLTTENAREFSSAAKGETLEDTIRTVEGYSDIIVMRHFESGAARRAASTASIPIINAGDGPGQHPTQALLDVYTIEREIGKLDGIKVALVGDLAYGRTVRSLAYLLAKYQDVKIYFVSPDVVKMKDDIKDYLTSMGVQWEESADLIEVASKCDVVYQTRIQRERFGERVDLYEEARGKYIVDTSVVNAMQKHGVVMHPLPRLDEITVDVDADPRAAYFRQAKNGLYIRMALLKLLLLGW